MFLKIEPDPLCIHSVGGFVADGMAEVWRCCGVAGPSMRKAQLARVAVGGAMTGSGGKGATGAFVRGSNVTRVRFCDGNR